MQMFPKIFKFQSTFVLPKRISVPISAMDLLKPTWMAQNLSARKKNGNTFTKAENKV